jgi:hypothetical protein
MCVYLAAMVAVVAFWLIIEGFGVVDGFERFARDVGFGEFELEPVQMLGGVALIGAVILVLMIVLTVMAGAFYNGLADRWGGLTVRFSAPATRPTRRTLPAAELGPTAEWMPTAGVTGNGNGDGMTRNGHAVPTGANGARERAPQGFD